MKYIHSENKNTNHLKLLHNIFSETLLIFSDPSVLTYVLGAQKNRLIGTVLLSTNNICYS